MKLLLDTHALIWVMNDHNRLGQSARNAILAQTNQVFVSVVSIWEASIKFRLGRFPLAAALLDDPRKVLNAMKMQDLPITLEHANLAGSISHPHKDPFDRMLAAQALSEGLTLVSVDTVFEDLAVARLW